VYPWVFPVMNFSPRIRRVHQPPTVRGAFARPPPPPSPSKIPPTTPASGLLAFGLSRIDLASLAVFPKLSGSADRTQTAALVNNMQRIRLSVALLALFCSLFLPVCSGSSSSPGGSGGQPGQGTGGTGGGSGGGSGGASGTGGSAGAGGNGGTGGGNGTGGSIGSGGSGGGGGDAGLDGGGLADARDGSRDLATAGDTGTLPPFSFFVSSLEAMRRLSNSQNGFGGDLRYGEATGLAGADKICTEIAEHSMPGSGVKGWRAFLSASRGPNGGPVHAIDRIGDGPWFDRVGRLVSMTKADLTAADRPATAHPAIKEDLPNEYGVPNHRPDPAQPPVDNHHVLTGSTYSGRLATGTTCLDWTSSSRDVRLTGYPQTGYSWSIASRRHWINGTPEAGCGAGVFIQDGGGPDFSNPIVGSGGGYGGIYCFALKP
jgi:hypothetical protein